MTSFHVLAAVLLTAALVFAQAPAPGGSGGGSSLPDQTSNGGKFLTTNGTTPSWASVQTARVVPKKAALCQDTAAATGFDLPASNPAVPACVTGAQTPNLKRGVLQFDGATNQTVQDAESATGCTTVTLKLYWNINDTVTGNTIIWTLRTMPLGSADVRTTASWNTQQSVTANPISTANGQIQTTITLDAGSLTGCVAGKRLVYELGRNAASDTSTATAELAAVEWSFQ